MTQYPSPEKHASPERRRREELANCLSHGIAIPLGVAGLVLLVANAHTRGDAVHVLGCTVFGASVVALYTASTLYHGAHSARRKHALRVVDHCCIYTLIAGTYTPFTLVHVGGTWGWSALGLIWTVALAGIVFKLFCTDRYELISTLSYLSMGWLLVLAAAPALGRIPPGGLILLGTGGMAYTLGVIFYQLDSRIPFGHAIWHLFVLAGTGSHYAAVLFYVVPPGAPAAG